MLADKTRAELTAAFARGAGHGLLQLGTVCVGQVLPPVWGWWRDFVASYVTALAVELTASALPMQEFLKTRNPQPDLEHGGLGAFQSG